MLTTRFPSLFYTNNKTKIVINLGGNYNYHVEDEYRKSIKNRLLDTFSIFTRWLRMVSSSQMRTQKPDERWKFFFPLHRIITIAFLDSEIKIQTVIIGGKEKKKIKWKWKWHFCLSSYTEVCESFHQHIFSTVSLNRLKSIGKNANW